VIPCRWVALIALTAVTATSGFAQQAQNRIYSNVEYNEEGGDLLGVELTISVNGSHVSGQLKIYQGGCADPTPVVGSLMGNKLNVSGAGNGLGKVELAGNLDADAVTGILKTANEKGEKIRLKRIQTPHC
jgi:hypothetical protein